MGTRGKSRTFGVNWLTTEQAAEILGVQPWKLTRLARNHRIQGAYQEYPGCDWRFDKEEIMRQKARKKRGD